MTASHPVSPRSRRLFSAALSLALLLLALLVAPAFAQEGAAEPPAAWIVVETGAGQTLVRPISATLPISGLAALQASGLEVEIAETDFGAAVCSIAGAGCPADDCFCNSEMFWNYGYWDGAAWVSYPIGASSTQITQTGAIESWRWGSFEGAPAVTPAEALAAQAALEWLAGQQAADGGFGNMGSSAETMIALGANGLSAADWQAPNATRSLEAYARAYQARWARTDPAAAGKLAVALSAVEACVWRWTKLPADFYDEETGTFGPSNGAHVWGILGTLAQGESVPVAALDALKAAQAPDGGWEWQPDFGPDSNTTALALQALITAGEPVTSTAVVSGLAWLKGLQQPDGGFAYDAAGGFGADANSTAYVIQALAAAGEEPAGDGWSLDGANPIAYLLSLQITEGADAGSFEWQAGTGANGFATQQSVAALLRQPLPIAQRALSLCGAP